MATTVLIAGRQERTHTRSPLALWHLLSLDAPAVAALWVSWAARCYGVTLPWTAPTALGIAVWMLYAADRMADAAGGIDLQERHLFHHRHRAAFAGAMAGCVPLLILLLLSLPPELRVAWMVLALPLVGYVIAVHLLRLRVPKEPLVGVFFAAACFLPVLLVLRWEAAAAALLFGGLCWLNCAALARWERSPRFAMDAGTAWVAGHLPVTCVMLITVAASLLFLPHARGIAAAVMLSTVSLLLVDRARKPMRPVHVRALADAALLTPLLLWPLHALAR